jgi:ubiquinone/menaquinone biosynthesis C-methylase UbiE
MKKDNIRWAVCIIEQKYPGWVGMDKIIDIFIRECIVPGGVVLDVGCGKRSPLACYRNDLRLLVGADLELRDLRENTDVKTLVLADGSGRLPFLSNTFDLIFSKTVIEHLLDPLMFFREMYRLLKPGGSFVWATSNLKSLPILVSYLTPLIVHKWVYRRVFGSKLTFDQFPTYYRANTKQAIHQQLIRAGFAKVSFCAASWPLYFAINRPLFLFFLPIHRLSDWLGLEFLQAHLIGAYRKEASNSE